MLIHTLKAVKFSDEEENYIKNLNIKVIYIDAFNIAEKASGNKLLANTVFIGLIWRLLKLNLETVVGVVTNEFKHKPQYIEPNIKSLEQGYAIDTSDISVSFNIKSFSKNWDKSLLITGNEAISLGGISAGVRAFYAYPMTPSSTILDYFSKTYKQTGILVKQAEDEITAANLAIGSMFMGTRALTATSGGGFDLMSESVSLAAMTETPFVCVLAQRPGPATGLPTWTSASDLNLAIYAGHGEFTRCVLAASDIESCYILIQHALNIAEKFQIPVILLTEKQVAESLFNVKNLPRPVKIERSLVTEKSELESLQSTDRYKITQNGISKRWIPGSSKATFNANSDEHLEDGTLTEDAEPSRVMYEKRMLKSELLYKNLPQPILYGDTNADITLVGWGSVKNTVLDVLRIFEQNKSKIKLNYLHYEFIYPLRTELLCDIANKAKKLVLIENNYMGQLGNLITSETGIFFDEKLLKANGRAFFIEDILDILNSKR